jgi:hypothetical protein
MEKTIELQAKRVAKDIASFASSKLDDSFFLYDGDLKAFLSAIEQAIIYNDLESAAVLKLAVLSCLGSSEQVDFKKFSISSGKNTLATSIIVNGGEKKDVAISTFLDTLKGQLSAFFNGTVKPRDLLTWLLEAHWTRTSKLPLQTHLFNMRTMLEDWIMALAPGKAGKDIVATLTNNPMVLDFFLDSFPATFQNPIRQSAAGIPGNLADLTQHLVKISQSLVSASSSGASSPGVSASSSASSPSKAKKPSTPPPKAEAKVAKPPKFACRACGEMHFEDACTDPDKEAKIAAAKKAYYEANKGKPADNLRPKKEVHVLDGNAHPHIPVELLLDDSKLAVWCSPDTCNPTITLLTHSAADELGIKIRARPKHGHPDVRLARGTFPVLAVQTIYMRFGSAYRAVTVEVIDDTALDTPVLLGLNDLELFQMVTDHNGKFYKVDGLEIPYVRGLPTAPAQLLHDPVDMPPLLGSDEEGPAPRDVHQLFDNADDASKAADELARQHLAAYAVPTHDSAATRAVAYVNEAESSSASSPDREVKVKPFSIDVATSEVRTAIIHGQEVRVNIGKDVPEEWKDKFIALLQKHQDAFYDPANPKFAYKTGFVHEIDFTPYEGYKKDGDRFYGPRKHDIIKASLKAQVDRGIKRIRLDLDPATIKHKVPHVVVSRDLSDGSSKDRVCGDYRRINKGTAPGKVPERKTVSEIIDRLARAHLIFGADGKDAYWQFELSESSRQFTYQVFEGVVYESLAAEFGQAHAGDTLQHFMNELLRPHDSALSYADDLWSVEEGAENYEQHFKDVDALLTDIERKKFKLGLKNISIAAHSVRAVGFDSGGGVKQIGSDRLAAFKSMPAPTDATTLMSLKSAFNYCRHFNPKFAELAAPLEELLKADAKWEWTEKHQRAFDLFKDMFTDPKYHVLRAYDPKRGVVVRSDASDKAGSSVLMQEDSSDSLLYPIGYDSFKFSAADLKKSATMKEFISLHHAVLHWRPYLDNGFVNLAQTDCMPLKGMVLNSFKHSDKVMRMILDINEMPLVLQHLSGRDNWLADLLSRLVNDTPEPTEVVSPFAALVSKDAALAEVIADLSGGPSCSSAQALAIVSAATRANLVVRDGVLYFYAPNRAGIMNARRVIPESLYDQVYTNYHASEFGGHLGLEKCYQRAVQHVWWPGMHSFFAERIAGCIPCFQNKRAQQVFPGQLTSTVSTDINDRWAFDFFQSPSGSNVILAVNDFSGYPEAAITPDQTSKTAARFSAQVFAQHGRYRHARTDNGPAFIGPEFKKQLEVLKTLQELIDPNHPQGNGAAERFVAIVKQILRILMEQLGGDEATALSFALKAIRDAPSSKTKVPPSEMHSGRPTISPLAFLWDVTPIGESVDQFMLNLRGSVKSMDEFAKVNYDANRIAAQEALDDKASPTPFSVGSLVGVKNTVSKAPLFNGPYPIISISGNSAVVATPSGEQRANFDKLKPFSGAEPERFVAPTAIDEADEAAWTQPPSTITSTQLVGQRVKVYWPSVKKWFTGSVTAAYKNSHLVLYDDDNSDEIIERFVGYKSPSKYLVLSSIFGTAERHS